MILSLGDNGNHPMRLLLKSGVALPRAAEPDPVQRARDPSAVQVFNQNSGGFGDRDPEIGAVNANPIQNSNLRTSHPQTLCGHWRDVKLEFQITIRVLSSTPGN